MLIADPNSSFMNAYGRGLEMGRGVQQMNRQNQLFDVYREHGQGIMQGDQNALNALAQVDPVQAFEIRGSAEANRRSAAIDSAKLDQIRQETRLAAAKEAERLSEAEREREARETARAVSMARAAYERGERAFGEFVMQNVNAIREAGIDPNQVTYESWPQFEAGLIGATEGLSEGLSSARGQQPEYKVVGGRLVAMGQGGVQDVTPWEAGGEGYRQVRGSDLGMTGENAERLFNIGPDGKVTGIGGAGTNVTVNTGAESSQWGEPPKDMVWLRDEQGNVVTEPTPDGRGVRPVAVPIAGSGPDRDRREAEESAEAKEKMTRRYADVVLEDIGRVLDAVENDGVLPVTGVGSVLSNVPGTRARDVAATLDTIRANVGFDRLQQMRDASPTGGALGQVTELENRLLQSTLGNLEQSQSEEQFVNNLRRLEKIYLDIIHGEGNWENDNGTIVVSDGEFPKDIPSDDVRNLSDEQLLRRLQGGS